MVSGQGRGVPSPSSENIPQAHDPQDPIENGPRDAPPFSLARLRAYFDNNPFPYKRLAAMIAFVGLVVMGMIVYSAQTGLRMSQRYTPLIDAAMEIKLEATMGHLWFEEILTNDRQAKIEDVRAHLDNADWYAQAMLHGGQNAEGTFIPLSDPELRAHIEGVRKLLAKFRIQMERRWENIQDSGPGTFQDRSFDAVFNQFIIEADIVETRLQALVQTAERNFLITQVVLGVLALSVMIALGMMLLYFSARQNHTVAALRREIVRRKKVEHVLREQATTDTLTGLKNRRKTNDELRNELNRAKRLRTPFSVVMLDIDHFKQINDTHGHEAGDRVLVMVAETIQSRLRGLDTLGRWGGEEFLIVLPGTTVQGAAELSNICRELLAQERLEGIGTITASFGVAQFSPHETVRELLHRVDEALYCAKRNGRNRVEVSPSPHAPEPVA